MELSKRDKERDKRLQKNYRWTLEQRNQLAALQGNKCAVCGRSESDKMPLNLDHVHFHITAMRGPRSLGEAGIKEGWNATCIELPIPYFWAKTKTEAIRLAREAALPLSVRGLLCPGRHGKAGHGCCNRLLGRVDNIEWLEKAAAYLKNPPARQILDKLEKS